MKLRINYFSRGLLLVAVMLLGTWAIAQRTISGTVTDAASKEPLIGANVLVVGTSVGSITDVDGTYSVSVPAGATELELYGCSLTPPWRVLCAAASWGNCEKIRTGCNIISSTPYPWVANWHGILRKYASCNDPANPKYADAYQT